MLKKPHLSDCCYKKNGDFNPTYHDRLGGERDRERDRERQRETDRQTDTERGGVHNRRE